MNDRRRTSEPDLDYELERLDATRQRSGLAMVQGFFKLAHRLDKAVEAIEHELDKLEKVHPAYARMLRRAWEEGEGPNDGAARLSGMALSIKERSVAPGLMLVEEAGPVNQQQN